MNEENKNYDSQIGENASRLNDNKSYSSINDFQVLKKIGQGTYSTVFKVRRLADDQIYALKKIKLDNMSKKEQQSALNEVRILASINHQNIIAYRQTFYEKGCLFLVLQFAENGDLSHEINLKKREKQHFSEIQIWQALLQISLALHTLHSQKIMHRDIKPANIFLTKQGIAKLGDLNVSKIVNKFCQTQTGTPYYASPQIWKDQPYDKKSDIWSLGCTMYQMATFSPPFAGEDLQAMFNQIVQGSFPPMPLYYSKQLHKIIGKMLQKQAKKRPSAQYILRNIQRIIPQVYKNLSIIQKIKGLFFKSQNYHATSFQLLRTIVFPPRMSRRNNEIYANSHLPSPSYSRDQSIDQLNDLNSSIASLTINLGVKNQMLREKRGKIKKGNSLHVHEDIDKENAGNYFKKNQLSIFKIKENKLPQIKRKAAKK